MVTYMNDLQYADRYVAYLDILGFTVLTEKAHEDLSYREFLRDLIKHINATLPRASEQSNFRFIQFSDCIVLSAKQDRQGLEVIIQAVTILVTQMLDRATLLRGGIALGNLHHDDEMMFGPGFLAAYAFDKKGSGPHVGLMNHVVTNMEHGLWEDSIEHLVRPDPWDLTPILHVLYEFEAYDGTTFDIGGFPIHSRAARLAEIITTNALDMTEPAAVRVKWRWMQDYWNRTVAVRGILPMAEPSDWKAVAALANEQEAAAIAAFNARQKDTPSAANQHHSRN
jgi:hypothetical protein